jgi:small subunit ribosomal protein S8
MTDPISDMIIRIKNAQIMGKMEVRIPRSKMKLAVAKVLKEEGYISGFCVEEKGCKGDLILSLKYFQGKPVIEDIRRVSKPGLRIYRGTGKLPTIMNGLGVAIVSTSKGVMTDRAARALGEGGEVLCYLT